MSSTRRSCEWAADPGAHAYVLSAPNSVERSWAWLIVAPQPPAISKTRRAATATNALAAVLRPAIPGSPSVLLSARTTGGRLAVAEYEHLVSDLPNTDGRPAYPSSRGDGLIYPRHPDRRRRTRLEVARPPGLESSRRLPGRSVAPRTPHARSPARRAPLAVPRSRQASPPALEPAGQTQRSVARWPTGPRVPDAGAIYSMIALGVASGVRWAPWVVVCALGAGQAPAPRASAIPGITDGE